MELKKDAQGKKKWFNEFGGGIYATASGGAITGFGAGIADSDEFGGAIIIDDPLKPDDALSEVRRSSVNNRYNGTIRSRINDEKTPIIVIMQRLHEEDLSGFLLDGGSGEEWTHLCLPALNDKNEPLYPKKHSFNDLQIIRNASKYNFSGQYMQIPSPEEGGEWKKAWFPIVKKAVLNPNIKWNMVIDGAYTKDNSNDPTGIQVRGMYKGIMYILSSIDKYLELPDLIKFIPTYIKALGVDIEMIYVEPKASGKSIKQILKDSTMLNVSEIKTPFVGMSKIERAKSASPYIEGGRACLVEGPWNEGFLDQIAMFPNAKHDEHIDLTCYSIEKEFIISKSSIYHYDTVQEIPKTAKRIVSGISLKQSPKYYCLLDAFVDGSKLYLDEVLFDNTLSSETHKGSTQISLAQKLKQIKFKKKQVIVGNNDGILELKDLISQGYSIRGVKNMVDDGIKRAKTYDIHVTNSSENLIKALNSWNWKQADDGTFLDVPDGKEPDALIAIRNIVLAKSLW